MPRYLILGPGQNVVERVVFYSSAPSTPPEGFRSGYIAIQNDGPAAEGWTYDSASSVFNPPANWQGVTNQSVMELLFSSQISTPSPYIEITIPFVWKKFRILIDGIAGSSASQINLFGNFYSNDAIQDPVNCIFGAIQSGTLNHGYACVDIERIGKFFKTGVAFSVLNSNGRVVTTGFPAQSPANASISNKIRVFFETGNITEGYFALFGVSK